MKKITRLAIAAISAFAVVLSCNKEQVTPVEEIASPDEEQQVPADPASSTTIMVNLPEDLATRVSFDPVINTTEGTDKGKITGLTLKWELTDKLIVANHANPSDKATFDCKSISDDGKKACFDGTLPSGTSFDISVEDGKSDSGFASISQPSDGVSNVKYWAAATDVAPEDLNNDFTLTHLSGVLAFTVKMPTSAIAAGIMSMEITASENIFYGGKNLTIRLDEAGDANNDGILYFFASLPAANCGSISACSLLIHLNAPGTAHTVYTRYLELGAQTFTAGKVNNININATESDTHAGKTSDDGSSAHPYLIGDPYQVAAINGLATGGATTYFKMIDDVDMTGVTHNHINTNSGYTQAVNFNGNNKTISNLTKDFFYVIKGSVYDLTLDNSDITARGILAEYCQGSGHTITNVTVSNGKVSNSSNNVGGLIGRVNSGVSGQTTVTITDCTVSGTHVKGASVIGGFIGFADELVSISGCKYTGGTVEASGMYCGGFIGSTADKASVISNCQVENATVKSTCTNDERCGGFIGQLQSNVQIKGCTVGTESKKVVISTVKPAESGKVLNVGGFVGVNYGTITKTDAGARSKAFVNITCTNTETGWYLNLGGFVGFTRGTIEYSDADVNMSGLKGQRIGGFAGFLTGGTQFACTIDNCTVTGAVSGNHYTGGLIAAIDAVEPTVTNNTVSCSVSGNSTVGGLIGVFGTVSSGGGFTTDAALNGTFTGNTVSGTVTGANNVGGIMGYCYGAATFSKNAVTNNLTPTGAPVGGIVGYTDAAITITKCYVSGAVKGSGNGVGGILGKSGNSLAVNINNSYTTGNVTNGAASQQIVGGIVGDLGSTGSVTNCYATGSISSGRVLGGIVGRAAKQGWNKSANDVDNIISGCIAFNPSVASVVGTVSNQGSSGPIIGYTSIYNVMEKCYRISTMTFRNSNTYGDTLYNQDDCDGTNWVLGTTPGTYGSGDYSNQCSYHGKAAATNATVTSVARDVIGWDSSVWDFTGALPTLK